MTDSFRKMEQSLFKRLSILMKHLQVLFRDLKVNRREETLKQCAQELNLFSFTSAFLDLEQLSLLSSLGQAFLNRITQENRPFSQEYLKLLSRLLKSLVALMRNVHKEGEGFLLSGDSTRVSNYWESQNVDITPIILALRKQLIRMEDHCFHRSISLAKDADFSHAITIPKSAMDKMQKNKWFTLIYLDLNHQENLNQLSLNFGQAKWDEELLLHGRLYLPERFFQGRDPGLAYYALIQTDEDPRSWMRTRGIKGRIIREIQKGSSTTTPILASPVMVTPKAVVENAPAPAPSTIEVPVISDEMLQSLNALAERNKRDEEREFYRQLNLKKGKVVKEGRGVSIGFKLILIITLVITISLSGMTWLSSFFFQRDVKTRVEQENLDTSSLWAQKTEQDFWGIFNKSQLLLLGISNDSTPSDFINFFFRKNPEFLYLGISSGDLSLINPDYALNNSISGEFIEQVVLADKMDILHEVSMGSSGEDAKIFNLSPYFDHPVTAVAFPYRQGARADSLVVLLDTEKLLNSILEAKGNKISFILTQQGEIIAHPELEQLLRNEDYSQHPIVLDIIENQGNDKQIQYTKTVIDPQTEIQEEVAMLGAYKRIPFGELVFITEVKQDPAFESIYRIQRQNFYIMFIVLSMSILIVYFYSKTITRPIGRLVIATKYIEKGNYDLPLRVRSRDETGILTASFLEMSKGLQEREHLKDSFGKFVNQEVAELAMKGDLKLGGETKEATVFFSDIRAFTSISEKLEPAEVVSFLNDYMTLMVQCVNKNGGFVDKFIGDAIMAVWGAPLSKGNDEENAINGALMMREVLKDFNKDRGSVKKPIIHIGCGINSGPVLAGQIGSDTRMEYTVIGDTVNLASRIEALNKPMGTDILISQDTKERVEGIYHLVPMNSIKVKGKTNPQQIYAVLGRKDSPHTPRNLESLRRELSIKGNFQGIADLEQEEIKYEILS